MAKTMKTKPRKPLRGKKTRAIYDIVSDTTTPGGGGRQRRAAKIEHHDEDVLFPSRKRAQSIGLARAAMRNLSSMKSIGKQLRVNVVGSLGKLYIVGDTEAEKEAMRWFNQEWAREGEFRAGLHWGELLQLTVLATANEGDCVLVHDDGLITGGNGTGKILTFESDQIGNVSSSYWAAHAPKGWKQDNGVVRDQYGRECGVIVSSRRGVSEYPPNECFILTRNPNEPVELCNWRHVKRQWRLSQGRGAGDSYSAINLLLDNAEILQREMQSAKLRAGQAAFVSQEAAEPSQLSDPRLDPESGVEDFDLDEDDPEVEVPAEPLTQYEQLEALAATEYLEKGDKVEFPSVDRPNVDLPGFLKYTTDSAGSSFGFAHAYAAMSAQSSYTSFRGDIVMSWASFYDNQKFLERYVCDWTAVRVLTWAIENGKIKAMPGGWQRRLAWVWPKTPSTDEEKHEKGIAAKIKNARTTFSEVIGPDWKERFEQLSEEIKFAKELGIPLSVLESKSGQLAEEIPDGDEGS